MGRTPDRKWGVSDEEGTIYSDEGVAATQEGEIRYTAGGFSMYDSAGVFDPRTGGGGISEAQHKALRQLVHFIEGPGTGWASGAYEEILPAGDPFPTSAIWYTDSGKTDKIVSQELTYNSNKTIATEVWKMYDSDGSTVLVTLTDTYAYSGIFVTSVTRTWS